MPNPFDPDPLNTPTCDVLNNEWNGNLSAEWKICMSDPNKKNNPERKNMSDQEKHAIATTDCCKYVMHCIHPNAWFREQIDIKARCPTHKVIGRPHFGDVKMSQMISEKHTLKVHETLSFGVV